MAQEDNFLLSERMKNDGKPIIKLNAVQTEAANIFRQDVANGLYDFETYDCECGAKYEELLTIAEKDRYGFDVVTKICPKCGLVMINPRMTQKSYDNFYDKMYRKIYRGSALAEENYFNTRKEHGKVVYDYLSGGGGYYLKKSKVFSTSAAA